MVRPLLVSTVFRPSVVFTIAVRTRVFLLLQKRHVGAGRVEACLCLSKSHRSMYLQNLIASFNRALITRNHVNMLSTTEKRPAQNCVKLLVPSNDDERP